MVNELITPPVNQRLIFNGRVGDYSDGSIVYNAVNSIRTRYIPSIYLTTQLAKIGQIMARDFNASQANQTQTPGVVNEVPFELSLSIPFGGRYIAAGVRKYLKHPAYARIPYRASDAEVLKNIPDDILQSNKDVVLSQGMVVTSDQLANIIQQIRGKGPVRNFVLFAAVISDQVTDLLSTSFPNLFIVRGQHEQAIKPNGFNGRSGRPNGFILANTRNFEEQLRVVNERSSPDILDY